jgi:hypothetical protein
LEEEEELDDLGFTVVEGLYEEDDS